MKQLLSMVAAAAIGLGGMTGCSTFHHNESTASAKSSQDNSKPAGYGGDTSFSKGGTAKIEDHRDDAGKQAQPASEKQSPSTNDDNNNDFSD